MARLFPMQQGAPRQKTFTSNEVWTAPAGVTSINITGKGQDGSPATWTATSISVMGCTKSSFNQPGGSLTSKNDAVADGAVSAGAFVGGTGERTVSYERVTYTVGPDNLSVRSSFTLSRTVRGSASVSSGSTSGNITHTPSSLTSVSVSVESKSGGSTGASATGFGYTFPGGSGGAATPATYTNVTVGPGNPYSVVVPSGGSITITWTE